MLLPLLLLLARAPPLAEPALAELMEDPPAAPTTTATTTAATATEATATAAPTATTATSFAPWALQFDAGLDVPVDQRLPMASVRLGGAGRLELPNLLVATIGLRTGYSYVAGQGAVADPTLGLDAAAFLMAHRVPLRGDLRLGVRADDGPFDRPLEMGIVASGGADLVFAQTNAFGRAASSTAVTPGLSLGAYLSFALDERLGIGVVGEWDSAAVDVRSTAPGVSGDLSAVRVALALSLSFGT